MNCHAMNTNIRDDGLGNVPIYDYADDLEPKESVLSFSFDHIYAITPDNVTFLQQPKDIVEECSANLDKLCNQQSQAQLEVETLKTQLKNAHTELFKLKKLASVHLDLIQKQSDLLTSKEKHNKALLLENQTLRSRHSRQKQNPPPLISFPAKPQTSKSLLIPEGSQHTSKSRKTATSTITTANTDPSQPSTSGYVYVKKPAQPPPTYKSEQIIKDPAVPHSSKTRVEYYTPQGGDLSLFSTSADLITPDTKLETFDCEFDKTEFDIYSIVKSTSLSRNTLEGSIYGTAADLDDPVKVKEEAFDAEDIFDRLSDNECPPYHKVEKSCRDFSYGESLTNISSSVLSTLSETKGSTSHKTVPWWPPTSTMVSSDFIDEIPVRFDTMAKKRSTPKGKGKGKGKKSHTSEASGITNDDTTNSLIRNMFIASDISDIPEKISPSLIEEPKVKNRFFRSKLSRDGSNNNRSEQVQEDELSAIYSFDPHDDKKPIKKETYRSDVDIFDFCISQQDAEPDLPPIPVEPKKKKHIYDPPTKVEAVKEAKRATSPSASVYSFEDSQETKIMEKPTSPEMKDGKRVKPRAFGLFGPEPTDFPVDASNNPSQRVTCYMNAAKGSKKDLSKSSITPGTSSYGPGGTMSIDAKKGRRKSTTGNNLMRGTSKNSKARCRANSLFSPNNPAYQRDRVGSTGRGRQRAQSAGSHTSAGSRSKSSCDVNLIKLNADLEFKNRCYAMISQPEYDFVNVGKQATKTQEVTPINTLEVPKWRIKTLKPAKVCKSEQEEKLDDIVFAKRHAKMELEEKRIKRWDYQRLKEQLHLKKLKDRQEKLNPGGKKLLYKPYKQRKVIPQSLWPNPEDVLAIEVVDKLPVSSFGELVPYYKPRKFCLPWLKKKRLRNNPDKKPQMQH